MTPRQTRFAEAWLRCRNETQAAVEAGYTPRSAHNQGSRLMKNEEVKEYIRARLRAQDAREVAKTDEVLKFLTAVMRGEEKDQFGLDAQLADRIKAGVELLKRYTAVEEGEEKEGQNIVIHFGGGEESAK